MNLGQCDSWHRLLAGVAIGCLLSGMPAPAQTGATLGVPSQGRVIPVEQVTDTRPNPAGSSVTLGLPRKSNGDTTKVALSPTAVALDAAHPPTDSGVYSERPAPAVAATVPFGRTREHPSTVVRGAIDEGYLRGTPDPATTTRGGFSGPWDWLQRSVHDSPLGPYCEWFHIKGTFLSDHAFDEFISPVTNPFFFEDPRALTELRPVFIFQNTPKKNPLFAGGNIEMFALQARLALNERFSIVMPKLGFIAFQPDPPSPLGDEIGFAEIIVGPKLTFWRDDAANILAAFGVHFEIPAGGGDVFQNTGSGSVVPYVTLGKELLDNLHFLGAIGYRAGFNSDRSDSFFVSLHADYEFYRIIYPFVEVNWFHYTSGGNRLVASFEGGDLFNFGSTGASGEDILTMGVGGRVKILGEQLQAGAAFEFPLTKGKDIMDWRITLDLIWRY